MRIAPFAILLIGVAFLADAQPAKRPSAKDVFEHATDLYRAGRYREAAGGYRQAYEIEPNTSTLLAAARAYYREKGIICVPWTDVAALRLQAIESKKIYDEWMGETSIAPRDELPPNPFEDDND